MSIIISPILVVTTSLSFSNTCFCSSKVVGLKNMILSSIFSYAGIICFNLVIENPPSVSIYITFLPCFAVSTAANTIRFVFPLPAGPYTVVIASVSYPPSRRSLIILVPQDIFSMVFVLFGGFIYFAYLNSENFRPKPI